MRNEKCFERALSFFPEPERRLLRRCAAGVAGTVCEIRLYAGKAAALQTDGAFLFCSEKGGLLPAPGPDLWRPDGAFLFGVLNRAAAYSLYLHEETLRQGFLSKNGCRIGVCGWSADGKMSAEGITSLNVRIPFTVEQNADPLLLRALDAGGGLLIVGPPGSGKTTALKQCVRALCSCGPGGCRRTAVVDTRGEFSEELLGDPRVISADVLPYRGKAEGIETAVRLFSPEFVVCDEIGGEAEAAAVLGALNTGVSFLASAHAPGPEALLRRAQIVRLLEAQVFGRILFLSPESRGRPVGLYTWEELRREVCGGGIACDSRLAVCGGACGKAQRKGSPSAFV